MEVNYTAPGKPEAWAALLPWGAVFQERPSLLPLSELCCSCSAAFSVPRFICPQSQSNMDPCTLLTTLALDEPCPSGHTRLSKHQGWPWSLSLGLPDPDPELLLQYPGFLSDKVITLPTLHSPSAPGSLSMGSSQTLILPNSRLRKEN